MWGKHILEPGHRKEVFLSTVGQSELPAGKAEADPQEGPSPGVGLKPEHFHKHMRRRGIGTRCTWGFA